MSKLEAAIRSQLENHIGRAQADHTTIENLKDTVELLESRNVILVNDLKNLKNAFDMLTEQSDSADAPDDMVKDMPSPYMVARGEVGVKEIRGGVHNARILEYHDTTGDFSDDETAWCASFVNWCMIQPYWNRERGVYIYKGASYNKNPKEMQALAAIVGTGKANARSFISDDFVSKYKRVGLDEARAGDVVVYWRGYRNGWQGHVGFYVSHDSNYIKTLGGNQGNEVKYSNYSRNQLLGLVRLS